MKELREARIDFFDKHVGYDFIIDIIETKDFIEVITSHGGDISQTRIYGLSENDFMITER